MPQIKFGPAAAFYFERDGIRILPIAHGTKQPRLGGFGKNAPDFTVPCEQFRELDLIAILTGPQLRWGGPGTPEAPTPYLLCIDIDGTEPDGLIESELGFRLPETLTSKSRRHLWYLVRPSAARDQLRQWVRVIEWDGGGVDLKWEGGYAVEKGEWDPPAGAPAGAEGCWDVSRIADLPDSIVQRLVELGNVSGALPDLPRALRELARIWPRESGRHAAALALGGLLARALVTAAEAEGALVRAEFWARTGTDDRTPDVLDSITNAAAGQAVYGWPELEKHLGGSDRLRRRTKRRVERLLWALRAKGATASAASAAGRPEEALALTDDRPNGPIVGDYVHDEAVPRPQRLGALLHILGRRDQVYVLGDALGEVQHDRFARYTQRHDVQTVLGVGPERFWSSGKGGPRLADAPADECHQISQMQNEAVTWSEHGIRVLSGVAKWPFLAPDGRIVTRSGFDVGSRWYLGEAAALTGGVEVAVSECPSHEDARDALRTLLVPVCEFPWASPESMAAWVSLVLSALARPAIRGTVPLHAIDAPTAGVGKSLCAALAGLIVLGRAPSVQHWTRNGEEQAKLLTSAAFDAAGEPYFLIDNQGRGEELGGDALEKMITADGHVGFRVLGRSQMLSVPWNAVMCATGNGLFLADDMRRRTVLMRLEPTLEHATARTVRRSWLCGPNVRQWVLERRAPLLSAALTILRAHWCAGRPQSPDGALKGFEAWSSVVADAIWWASGIDVRAAAPEAADDHTSMGLDDILRSLPTSREEAITFSEIAHLGAGGSVTAHTLRNAVRDMGPKGLELANLSARSWSRLISSHVGNPRPSGTLRRRILDGVVRWWCQPPVGPNGDST